MSLLVTIITGLTIYAGMEINFIIYRKIREKNARYLRISLILMVFMDLNIGIWADACPGYVTGYVEKFGIAGIAAAFCLGVAARADMKQRVVLQLLERYQERYHGISSEYDSVDFKWRNTKKIVRALNHIFRLCSRYLIAKETELMFSIKKEAGNRIHIVVKVKHLGRKLHPMQFNIMKAEIEQSRRWARNTEIKVLLME